MAVKIFLDANVLLDYTLKREFSDDTKVILEQVVDNRVQAFITSSVLHIIGYWTSKSYGNAKAKEMLLTLLTDITIIDISHETALVSLHSKINDIEDALQYYAAIHHKLDYFISRDAQLKKESMPVLPVFTPKELIQALNLS
jgi:predicted nucleic acid-binding protein